MRSLTRWAVWFFMLAFAGVLGLAIGGVILLKGQALPQPKTMQAQKFVVVDADGRTRASLGMFLDEPELKLYDAEGKTRVWLMALREQSGIRVLDSKGSVLAGFGVSEVGPAVGLKDQNGKVSANLIVKAAGPEFSLFGSDGKLLWSAPTTSSLSPAPSQVGTGEVCVESYPEDADIYVDDRFVGSAPSALKLPAGEHLIEARLPGGAPWQRRVTILAGSNVVLKAYWEKPIFRPKSCTQR